MSVAALVARLICQRCWRSRPAGDCTCQPGSIAELDTLAQRVQDRHEQSVRDAQHVADPLPPAPERTRWVSCPTVRDIAHLVGGDGRSLCGHAQVGLGSRPAVNGARWCRSCAARTETA